MGVAIGRAYAALGLFQPAGRLYSLALEQRRAGLPPDHPDVAAAVELVARSHAAQGRLEEGLLMGEEALSMRERALGPRHTDVAANLALIARMRISLEHEDPMIYNLVRGRGDRLRGQRPGRLRNRGAQAHPRGS